MKSHSIVEGRVFHPSVKHVIINKDPHQLDLVNVTIMFNGNKNFTSLYITRDLTKSSAEQTREIGQIVLDSIMQCLTSMASIGLGKIESYLLDGYYDQG